MPETPETPETPESLASVYLYEVYSGWMAIRSFSDSGVEDFFITGRVPKRAGWSSVALVAKRKLDMLDYADGLADLRSPPGNRLEALKGTLSGFHSIRVNEQWRICFVWRQGHAYEVEIADYH